jgi:hypothetical protein
MASVVLAEYFHRPDRMAFVRVCSQWDLVITDQQVRARTCNSTFARDVGHSPCQQESDEVGAPTLLEATLDRILVKVWLVIYHSIGQCDWPALLQSCDRFQHHSPRYSRMHGKFGTKDQYHHYQATWNICRG